MRIRDIPAVQRVMRERRLAPDPKATRVLEAAGLLERRYTDEGVQFRETAPDLRDVIVDQEIRAREKEVTDDDT